MTDAILHQPKELKKVLEKGGCVHDGHVLFLIREEPTHEVVVMIEGHLQVCPTCLAAAAHAIVRGMPIHEARVHVESRPARLMPA